MEPAAVGAQTFGGMKKSEQKMKKLAILSVVTLMAGCATVDGVGQDISGAARTVQGWFR